MARTLQAAGLPTIYALCVLSGVFVNSTVPLFFELAVDAAYPVSEGLTTVLLTLLNNVFGLIFLLLPTIGIQVGNWVNVLSGSACAIAAVFMVAFNGSLQRTRVDMGTDAAV